jgi:serine protease Do
MRTLKQNRWGLSFLAACMLFVGAAVAVSQQQESTQPGIEHAEALSITFRDAARKVLPAVVSIETRAKSVQISNNGQGLRSPLEEEFFKRFFGENLPPELEQNFRQQQMPQRRGSGSGFIVDADGVILTNAHVVSGADRVVVTLDDGRELEATEWHADPRSDVAIVRVEAGEKLPTVPFGDSSQIEIGDWVLALGNPFDIGTTVTSGIISAKGRSPGVNGDGVESYLQTDAAINPGNSGGPLVNLRGEVVGINTAISTRSGGYDGVGFAIPVNTARWVAEQLIATGSVKRAYLGVTLQPMSADLRRQFGVDVSEGALVASVFEGSPAAAADVDTGDVIVAFAGEKVRNSSQLQGIVERLEVDKMYPMTVVRDGERVRLEVTLKQMPGDFTPALNRAMKQPESSTTQQQYDELGLEVLSLDSEAAAQLSLPEGAEGVLVGSVESGSPASSAGLRRGDVIHKVGSTKVTSPDEFAEAVKELSLENGVALLVSRDGNNRFVVLKNER